MSLGFEHVIRDAAMAAKARRLVLTDRRERFLVSRAKRCHLMCGWEICYSLCKSLQGVDRSNCTIDVEDQVDCKNCLKQAEKMAQFAAAGLDLGGEETNYNWGDDHEMQILLDQLRDYGERDSDRRYLLFYERLVRFQLIREGRTRCVVPERDVVDNVVEFLHATGPTPWDQIERS